MFFLMMKTLVSHQCELKIVSTTVYDKIVLLTSVKWGWDENRIASVL